MGNGVSKKKRSKPRKEPRVRKRSDGSLSFSDNSSLNNNISSLPNGYQNGTDSLRSRSSIGSTRSIKSRDSVDVTPQNGVSRTPSFTTAAVDDGEVNLKTKEDTSAKSPSSLHKDSGKMQNGHVKTSNDEMGVENGSIRSGTHSLSQVITPALPETASTLTVASDSLAQKNSTNTTHFKRRLRNGISNLTTNGKNANVTLVWEAYKDSKGKLSRVCDVTFLPNDLLTVCRSCDNKHTWDGIQLYGIGDGGRPGRSLAKAYIQGAQSLCVNQDSHLAATDTIDRTIKFFDLGGDLLGTWKKNKFQQPGQIAVTREGRFIVPDIARKEGCMGLYSPYGKVLLRFGLERLESPWYVTVDRKNRVLVSDSHTNTVNIFDDRGKFLSNFGGTANGTKESRLSNPGGIVVDQQNNIIVVDSDHYRVAMFSPDGLFIKNLVTNVRAKPVSVAYDNGYLAMATESDIKLYQTYSETTSL